ncbi:hypothetical protein ABIB45_001751 [Arthrobacter sp. UYCo732]
MNKPGACQFFRIIGLAMQGVGGAIYFGAVLSSLSWTSILSDASGSSVGMANGAIIALIGWIVPLSGISRAGAGIDYLVNAALVALIPIDGRETGKQGGEQRRIAPVVPDCFEAVRDFLALLDGYVGCLSFYMRAV